MLKISLRRIVALLSMGAVLPIGACLNSGLARDVLIDQALDFLTGNNTVLDLFTGF